MKLSVPSEYSYIEKCCFINFGDYSRLWHVKGQKPRPEMRRFDDFIKCNFLYSYSITYVMTDNGRDSQYHSGYLQ